MTWLRRRPFKESDFVGIKQDQVAFSIRGDFRGWHRAGIFSEPVLRFCKRFGQSGKPLPYWLGVVLVAIAQRIAERRHARVRSELMRIDGQVSDMLAFTGRAE